MYFAGLGGIYYLKNGQPASSYVVGDTMGFNVPGYSQVWLEQTQNGNPQYTGVFNLPMAPYVLQSRDVGAFNASVYEYKNGVKGRLIGTDSVQVLATIQPATANINYAPPVVNAVLAPGYVNPTVTPSGVPLLPSGVMTPSAPAPAPGTVLFNPTQPVDLGPMPSEAPETHQAGFGLGLDATSLLLVGLGLFFVFGRSRR
jgi:hypothetical protein